MALSLDLAAAYNFIILWIISTISDSFNRRGRPAGFPDWPGLNFVLFGGLPYIFSAVFRSDTAMHTMARQVKWKRRALL